ncbi:MAG: S9 family peptidase [Gammaproteobacteria bacterium]|nr:S9 family peptidase [Gammaproteobacteria bacterium]
MAPAQSGKLSYPAARTVEQMDDYHGVKIADPYRWLEDDNSAETKAWVKEQQALTSGYLAAIPEREAIAKRLSALWNYEKFHVQVAGGNGFPAVTIRKGRYFFWKNDGLQNQWVLYVSQGVKGEPKMVLDPNTFSADGTASVGALSISPDGKRVAYAISKAGSDWQTWKVRDVDSGKDLADTLEWVKFSGAGWTADSKGFYYSRYDKPAEGKALTEANYHQKLFFHQLGDAQDQDVLTYARPDQKEWGFGGEVTDDGRYLVVYVSHGTDTRNRIYYRDLKTKDAQVLPLLDDFDASYGLIGNDGPVFYFNTDKDAPKGRIIAVDIRKPEKANWKELVKEGEDAIHSVSLVHNRFAIEYLHDAFSRVKLFTKAGVFEHEVQLPGLGVANDFGGETKGDEAFYAFTTYTSAPVLYRYDFAKKSSAVFKAPKLAYDPADYTTEQAFFTSKDGTRVPIALSYKKGLKKDRANPTLLFGYGGFNIAISPNSRYSGALMAWMEMGGVFAVANIRGGSEYGEAWHQAGMLKNKQNVFDDFIAAGEWLIAEKWTSTPKLAAWGRSNGGLLAGAMLTQRPDLFGAVLPEVGVLDMLRYHKFTIGWAWAPEYGSADNKDLFPVLKAYSPLHNIKPGTRYPATLVLTADHDDRVVPAHSFKFAAALQKAQAGEAPILARIESNAGHGAGKPTAMQIAHAADYLSFLVKELGVKLPQ